MSWDIFSPHSKSETENDCFTFKYMMPKKYIGSHKPFIYSLYVLPTVISQTNNFSVATVLMNWVSCFIYNSNKFPHCVFEQLQLKWKEKFQIFCCQVEYVMTLYLHISIPIFFQCGILCCNQLCTASMSFISHTNMLRKTIRTTNTMDAFNWRQSNLWHRRYFWYNTKN